MVSVGVIDGIKISFVYLSEPKATNKFTLLKLTHCARLVCFLMNQAIDLYT